ncbi:MAG: hypothetical protein JRH10_02470 [Deltaproteobacteria bacterium]|nr:hypothetical protein [Deltaproteobacteria bacterium]MBW2444723.1 hypothetical protein [Deltaproteobacteria bacterium]
MTRNVATPHPREAAPRFLEQAIAEQIHAQNEVALRSPGVAPQHGWHAMPALLEDLPPRLLFSLLLSAIRHAVDPDRWDRLGLSPQETVTHTVDHWARGAFKRPQRSVVPPAVD